MYREGRGIYVIAMAMMGALDGGGGAILHVDFKKAQCRPVEFKKYSCRPV